MLKLWNWNCSFICLWSILPYPVWYLSYGRGLFTWTKETSQETNPSFVLIIWGQRRANCVFVLCFCNLKCIRSWFFFLFFSFAGLFWRWVCCEIYRDLRSWENKMEPPKGFLASLWSFICFLPYFIGLLLLGIIKGNFFFNCQFCSWFGSILFW